MANGDRASGGQQRKARQHVVRVVHTASPIEVKADKANFSSLVQMLTGMQAAIASSTTTASSIASEKRDGSMRPYIAPPLPKKAKLSCLPQRSPPAYERAPIGRIHHEHCPAEGGAASTPDAADTLMPTDHVNEAVAGTSPAHSSTTSAAPTLAFDAALPELSPSLIAVSPRIPSGNALQSEVVGLSMEECNESFSCWPPLSNHINDELLLDLDLFFIASLWPCGENSSLSSPKPLSL